MTHHGDVTLLCFAGDPFHSSSDFDLDLAEDGGKTVVSSSRIFTLFGSGCQGSGITKDHLQPTFRFR